jgi:NADH-quinone oxidoreductase chain G
MVTVIINGVKVIVDKNSTVLQACESVGIEIPRFCFHERLSVAGNCRMCLVEIEKSPKPQASCALPVMDNMKIFTDTPLVKKAREAVLEFLLINHPLDCPICDQGGECDLQDQAMVYGNDSSRFYEYKRGVENKNVGPLVKMIMTRCIHCTRCVRFMTEVAGVGDFGTTGRGNSTEIGTYIEKNLNSELSGNIVDLCPVGALTSKPYAFKARPWELTSFDTIDISDGLGCNIWAEFKGNELVRVLPRCNEQINEEWISDKTRHCYDGLKFQRILSPIIFDKRFKQLSWESILDHVATWNRDVKNSFLPVFGGNCLDLETYDYINVLLNKNNLNKLDQFGFKSNFYSSYADFTQNFLFNSTIEGLEEADLCLLIGTNPRFEASVLNARIRKLVSKGNLKVAFIGSGFDSQNLTYDATHLGSNGSALKRLLLGEHWFCNDIIKAKKVAVIQGFSSITEDGSEDSYRLLFEYLCSSIKLISAQNINILHTNISDCSRLFVGLSSNNFDLYESYYYFNSNNNIESNISSLCFFGNNDVEHFIFKNTNLVWYDLNTKSIVHQKSSGPLSEVIYLNSHGSNSSSLMNNVDLILPVSSFMEKNTKYINTEGRVLSTKKCFEASKNVITDKCALDRTFGEALQACSPWKEAQNNTHLEHTLGHDNELIFDSYLPSRFVFNVNREVLFVPKLDNYTSSIKNFYRTDDISYNSPVMAKCSKIFDQISNFK